ncbi:hypothetical protein GL297_07515 [Komagataeibacter sp. FXV2]|nr:hypothetical protein [Komagataeibacter sp. FXV2]
MMVPMTVAMMSVMGVAQAHRLDEYLQATMIDLHRQHIDISLRLTPGREVAAAVIRQIDSNGDGILSPDEQYAYAGRIARGLKLSLNGHSLPLRTGNAVFPSVAAMRTGDGVIGLHYEATVALAPGAYHLAYANQGQGPDAVYLVNALMPDDPAIHTGGQQRSAEQSSYALDFIVDH